MDPSTHAELKPHRGLEWSKVDPVRRSPRTLRRRDIPSSPGVYVWFRDGEPVYVGEALGKAGLRGRLPAHLALRNDLSRSTLRASVALAELQVPRSRSRQRPSVMTHDEIAAVNDWIGACELGWIECASVDEAHRLEMALRREWLPPLNIL